MDGPETACDGTCDRSREIDRLRASVRRLEATVAELESRLARAEQTLEPLGREAAVERHRPLIGRLRFERRFGKL